jgi:uncharacterized protein
MIPIAFKKYLYHFHVDRDYFECHEILEEYWKEETTQQKDSIWVGFILLAVANYHHRRGNFSGASKTLQKAHNIFKMRQDEIVKYGLDQQEFFQLLDNHTDLVEKNQPYCSYQLPISDNNLIIQCRNIYGDENQLWGIESNLSHSELIHRHMLRDRSDVIAQRDLSLVNRKKKDSG